MASLHPSVKFPNKSISQWISTSIRHSGSETNLSGLLSENFTLSLLKEIGGSVELGVSPKDRSDILTDLFY